MVIKAFIAMPPGDGDEPLGKESLTAFELIRSLKRTPSIDRYPGSVVLRAFKRGTVVCRQGEAGHSAFYLPTTDDLLKLRTHQRAVVQTSDGPNEEIVKKITDEIAQLTARNVAIASTTSESDRPRMATVFLTGGGAESPPGGPIRRTLARVTGRRRNTSARRSIPIDAPTDVDFNTRQAPLYEGDVFGEMSCLNLTPRSTTIIADCDCYVLEMSRNIFDAIDRDAGYQAWMGDVYAKRVLETHLENSEFFRVLNDEQRSRICASANLRVAKPGAILVDEGDPSDSVFIIRNGLVQVVKEANVSLKPTQISDWPALCRDLLQGAEHTPASPTPGAKPNSPNDAGGEKPSPVDILASASVKKKDPSAVSEAPDVQPPRPAKSKKDVKDVLAAARGKPPATADAKLDSSQGPAAGKKPISPADILAAERNKTKTTPTPSDPGAPASPTAKPKMSAADILSMAKGKRTTSSAAGTKKSAPTTVDASAPAASCVKLWTMLGKKVQAVVRRGAAGESPSPDDQDVLLEKLLFLMRSREFLSAKEFKKDLGSSQVQSAIRSFPKGAGGIKREWSDLEVRLGGWALMQAIYPNSFPKRDVSRGTPLIFKYLSRGECFGEIGVIKDLPRSATCIAYDHPPDESGRKPSRVEFVEIPAKVFKQLISESPQLNATVTELANQRLEEQRRLRQSLPWEAEDSILLTPEYRDAGFVQGQRLLLIDLDRCTRCGDCVQACIDTHDDGNTRLFLDGPTFDRFLVPSACRSCLNPACMIGCPVGSIERGENGQIEIRDWCIGCGLCANQCPYDSIQMHDTGIVTPARSGWRVTVDANPQSHSWRKRRARDKRWIDAANPLVWNLDLRTEIALRDTAARNNRDLVSFAPLRVRHEFSVSRAQIRGHNHFRLTVASTVGLSLEFWLNGQPLAFSRDEKRKRNDGEIRIPKQLLRIGNNTIACRIGTEMSDGAADTAAGEQLQYNSVLLELRLDPIADVSHLPIHLASESTTAEIDVVTHRAAVCDLCSSLPGKQPACVEMCPHEAAIRIDARSSFEDLVEHGFHTVIKQ